MGAIIHMALARLQLDVPQPQPAQASAFFRRGQDKEVESEDAAKLLPLLDHHDDEAPACTRRRRTRAFRAASRCQVT